MIATYLIVSCSSLSLGRRQRWPGESGRLGKWSFCLKAARMPRIRRDHDKTDETEPHTGLQGEGGVGCFEGREDGGRAGAVFRCPSEPDHRLEGPVARRGGGCVRLGSGSAGAGGGCEDAACQDRRADAG